MHSAVNPLTAKYGTAHGLVVGLLFPEVLLFNSKDSLILERYSQLLASSQKFSSDKNNLSMINWLKKIMCRGGLPRRLQEIGVAKPAIADLAKKAAGQWTAQFNPRIISEENFKNIYEKSF